MPATEADSATVSGFADLDLSKDDPSNATTNDGFTELQLSELERQILDLYDRLEELQLEISLLNAQAKSSASKCIFGEKVYSRDLSLSSNLRCCC